MMQFRAMLWWEMDQMWRGAGLRILLIVLFLLSLASSFLGQTQVFDVILPRNSAPVLWGTFVVISTLLGLITFVLTVEYLMRDRRDRIEETLATAPLSNLWYAIAKYITAICGTMLLAFSVLVALLCLQVVLHIVGSTDYPSLAFDRYIFLWILLPVPAAAFACAIGFLGSYLFHGNRLALYALFFVFWLVPLSIGSAVHIDPDLTGQQFVQNQAVPYYQHIEQTFIIAAGGPQPGQSPTQQPSTFSLIPQKEALIVAVNTWPPNMLDLIISRLEEVGVAEFIVILGIWRFQRFQPEGRRV